MIAGQRVRRPATPPFPRQSNPSTRHDDCEMNLALARRPSRANGEDLLMIRPSRRKMRSEEE